MGKGKVSEARRAARLWRRFRRLLREAGQGGAKDEGGQDSVTCALHMLHGQEGKPRELEYEECYEECERKIEDAATGIVDQSMEDPGDPEIRMVAPSKVEKGREAVSERN